MGSSNLIGIGPVFTGPFAGLNDSLVRSADLSILLASWGDVSNGIDTRLEYPFFNDWLERVHARFHAAVS